MSEEKEEPIQEEELQDNPEVLDLRKKLTGMSKDSMKKTTDEIRTEISQMSSKIKQLKKTREEYNSQARHHKSMRDNVSDEKFVQIEGIQDEANKHKELRDECNIQIKNNKERREILRDELRDAWDKVNELRQKYYKMKDEVGVLPEDLTNEIRDLEWKQQTESLDADEDAEITKRISELYEKAYTAHVIGFSSDELEIAINTAKKLSEEHEKAHLNVLHYHEEGQKHHQKMLDFYKQLDGMRTSGSGLHEKYLEARHSADISHQKIVEIYERIKINQYLMDMIDDEQIRRRQERSQKLKKERIEETKKKQTSSKRMTLEELKLLMGEDEE
ncbi:MAG: hypothetical protein JJE41_06750 [Candidatus Heimdallarchaeota archaeon]|nr:hypothetical protein [Candidatus Heimdallarchaeota archaeon]